MNKHVIDQRWTKVIRDLSIMSGQPTVGGTRVLAETVMGELQDGATPAEIFDQYETLPPGTIKAVEAWAEATYGPGWRTRP